MLLRKNMITLIACGLLGATAPAHADAVTDWNAITVDAINTGRPGPGPIGVVDVALVQIAVHDAVQAIDRRFEPYLVEVAGARGRRSAAVAAAAHDMLVGMFPAQADTLDATYFTYLANHGLSGDPGILVGQKVALRVLPLRRVNPNPLPPPFVGGNNLGQWRPTPSYLGNPPVPPPFSAMAAPWMGEFDPFTLTSPTRFRAPPPPSLTSALYTRDYNEVKALGALVNSSRTAEQTDLAYFYSGNIPAQWNSVLRGIANRYLHRTGDSARLFALASMAVADALITSWDTKTHYAYWRPVTAIQEGNNDGNPHTVGDPAWQPLINTPPYPDYSSGANNLTGATLRTLQLFFGTDRVTFDVTTLVPQAVRKTRTYHRFSEAAQDMVNARIYLGIHFRTADIVARVQGRRVAEWSFNHFLLPLDDDHDD
jgi:hypothetical protein